MEQYFSYKELRTVSLRMIHLAGNQKENRLTFFNNNMRNFHVEIKPAHTSNFTSLRVVLICKYKLKCCIVNLFKVLHTTIILVSVTCT